MAEQLGFSGTEVDSAASGSPLGGYAVAGIDNPYLATGLAGVIGVGVALLIALVLARLVRPRQGAAERETEKV